MRQYWHSVSFCAHIGHRRKLASNQSSIKNFVIFVIWFFQFSCIMWVMRMNSGGSKHWFQSGDLSPIIIQAYQSSDIFCRDCTDFKCISSFIPLSVLVFSCLSQMGSLISNPFLVINGMISFLDIEPKQQNISKSVGFYTSGTLGLVSCWLG